MVNKITLELKGVTPMEVARYGKLMQIIIASGALDVRHGTTLIHWKDSILEDVEIREHPYRRKALDKHRGNRL